jgi:phosphate transport system permease protein
VKLLRKVEAFFFRILMLIASMIVIVALGSLLYTVIAKGLPYLSWNMVSKIPQGGFYIGKEGGILNAMIGSLYIAGGATILGLMTSIPVVLFINVYLRKNSWVGNTLRLFADILFGIPSIVYGAFGFTIMVFFGLKTSLLAGMITVALLIMPILVRAMDEVVKMTTHELPEAVLSLGATQWETAKMVLRQTAPGLFIALLISFGRAIGDAASVLFTAGYTDSIPVSLNEPAATLPLAIFFQLGSPVKEVQGRAYASALILTFLILIISLVARLIRKKFLKNIS